MEKVAIQQMLVLIDKPSFALPLEGQMHYQKEEVQGQMFLTKQFPFSPSDQVGVPGFEKQIATHMYMSVINLQLLT